MRPLPEGLRQEILDYIRRERISQGPVFCTREGTSMTRSNVNYLIGLVSREAQVEEEKTPRTVKRYRDGGGPSVTAAVTQDIGNYVGGYEFSVQFSVGKISFSKVGNLGGSIEVGTFVEGGNNEYPMIYKTPRRQPDVLTLQRGVPDSTMGNLLLSQLKEGSKVFGLLIFVKKNGSTVKTFSITEGIILSRKYSNLDSNSSEIFIQQLEIAHTGITEV